MQGDEAKKGINQKSPSLDWINKQSLNKRTNRRQYLTFEGKKTNKKVFVVSYRQGDQIGRISAY
jgi:hypothetical protein